MISLIENKQLKYTIHQLPSKFIRSNGECFYGGYQSRTDLHFEDGWREDIYPEIDNSEYYLGNRYYDAEKDIVTFEINKIEKPILDLEVEKVNRLNELKYNTNIKLKETDWYVTRFIELGTEIPEDIKLQRELIRKEHNERELYIKNAQSISEF